VQVIAVTEQAVIVTTMFRSEVQTDG
jgi:hypothetical protein